MLSIIEPLIKQLKIKNTEYTINDTLTNNINFIIIQKLFENILNNKISNCASIIKFNNIRTELYPYQINNINWMYDIENSIYDEKYEIHKKKK